ncbi:hypothetical protein KRIGEM_01204 [Komagataeibacter rhaeticus]|nr:hypothetical protein KRIGEM_01204 [Komagataeibacter rhaeticus]
MAFLFAISHPVPATWLMLNMSIKDMAGVGRESKA